MVINGSLWSTKEPLVQRNKGKSQMASSCQQPARHKTTGEVNETDGRKLSLH